jgi:hypothetical protein
LLDAAEQSIRQSSETAAELAGDHHLSAVATLTCNWTISSARDLAWNNARLLWAVRNDPLARGPFLDSLTAKTATGKPDAAGGGLRPPGGSTPGQRGFWRRPFPETDDLSPISRYLVSD